MTEPATLNEALTAHYTGQAESITAAEVARRADPANAMVPDPFAPGELCPQWQTGIHPIQRDQESLRRRIESSQESA
jgi:hypothetical protein